MRERFLVLDGLRGICALCVMARHLVDRPAWLGPYTYLCVDFFFVLSGFVLAHAYEARMREPGAVAGFLRERVIRLHPLLIPSIIPGAVTMMLGQQRIDAYPWLTILFSAVPLPAVWRLGLPYLPFPLNGPSWSLFWELVVNIVFAFAAPHLRTRTLIAVTATTGLVLTIASFIGGTADGHSALAGLRGLALFPLGVLLLRVHRSGRIRLGRLGVLCAPLLLLIVMTPGPFQAPREVLVRFVLFPLILLAGASRETRFPRTCALLGELSYPLYILHLPLLWLVELSSFALLGRYNDMAGALVCLPIVWVIWRFYDAPFRAWLRRRWGWRKPPKPEASNLPLEAARS